MYWVLLGFNWFYLVLLGVTKVSLGFTGFYLVLPSFTGFNLVTLANPFRFTNYLVLGSELSGAFFLFLPFNDTVFSA